MEDPARPFAEPPHAKGPDDGEGESRLARALRDDAKANQELNASKDGVGQDRLVVDDRSVPGDRVGHPARIPARQPVQHPAETTGSPGEHERLDLEYSVEQPDGG